MKILQINSVCGKGSTGRIATDIGEILEEKGHESYIAYGRDEPKNCDNAIRIGNKLDNYKHVAKTRILDLHGFGSKKATKNFIEKVKQLNPDVIHLHNIHGYYINIEILFEYLKEANKPVVWTLHDCWSFTGHCVYFDYNDCKCWTGEEKCIQKKSYPKSLLLNNSINNYKRKKKVFTGMKNLTIVTPSEWLARLVEKSFLQEYPVKVINNGIDLNIFKPTFSDFREKNNLKDKFIILGVANIWNEKKGLNYFKKLASKLQKDEKIVLVGLTKKQIKKLPKNIIGITQTDNIEELADIYSAADVFVNPTLEEVMGLTNVEALACGTPVVTFNTGGSIECIDDKTGLIASKGNLKDLIEKIKIIKAKRSTELAERCLKRAQRFYNKNDRYNEYIKLYKGANN